MTSILYFFNSYYTFSHLRELYTKTLKDYQPGIIIFNDNSILASTKDGFIEILELQIQGKRKMTSFEFINGYKTLDKQQLN